MEKTLKDLLNRTPVLVEAPWGKKIPCVGEFVFDVRYPLTDNYPECQTVFLFGKNKEKDLLYVSRFAAREKGKMVSPSTPSPGLDPKYITGVEVRRLYRLE